MNGNVKELIERVTSFYASNRWQTSDAAMEWLQLIPLLNKLELADATEAFEWLTVCVLMSQTDSHYSGHTSVETPLDECMIKLREIISYQFWGKILEIYFSNQDETQAKEEITVLIGPIPQFSRAAIRRAKILSSNFPLADYATACLSQPTPDMFIG